MNAEFFEQIEAYLEGAISKETLRELAKAEGVKDLDEAIRWFEDSQTAIEAAGLRAQLQEALPKVAQKETQVRRLRPIRTILAAAASVLIIVVAYFGFVRDNEPGLYAKYEYVDPGLPVLMSQSKDHMLYDAMTYFGEGNYEVAAEKLIQIQDQYAGSDTLSYYLGASLLYQGQTEEARTALQPVTEMEDSRFREKAEWLLVLTALKEKDEEKARSALQRILEQPDHAFIEEAKQLQKDVK